MATRADLVEYVYTAEDWDACRGRRRRVEHGVGLILSDDAVKIFCVARPELEIFEMIVRPDGALKFLLNGSSQLLLPDYLPEHTMAFIQTRAVEVSSDCVQTMISYVLSLDALCRHQKFLQDLLKDEKKV